jgi:hypothetical protein
MRKEGSRAALLALIAVIVLFGWQCLTVHFNYGGNWTGLFCIRPGMPVPAFLKAEHLYIFENSAGYDGMVYHLIAHDPWMRKGSPLAIGAASFRYQRILVPALAWVVAFGQDRWIHAAYFGVILGFAFLGVYWLSLWASRAGFAPAWGLLFALTPAALTSIDRMTVDIALAAFVAGFAVYSAESPGWRMLLVLTCAGLTRETAVPLIGGYALFLVSRRQFRDAALTAATALPTVAWFLYLARLGRSGVEGYLSPVPLAGFFERVIHPAVYPVSAARNSVVQGFDLISLAGVALGIALAVRLAVWRKWNPRAAAMYALAAAAIFLGSRGVWEEAYAFGRVMTPFLLLTAIESVAAYPALALLPMLLIDARLGMNFVGQIRGVLHGLTGL